MKKWCILMLMTALAAGARASEATITCETIANEVGVSVRWTLLPRMGYTLQGKQELVFGDWVDLTDRVVTQGLFETNMPSVDACFFFKVEERMLVAPSDGMVLIPAGSNSGNDPDVGTYSLTVDNFWMDETEVTKEEWDEVARWAFEHGYTISPEQGASKASGHPVYALRWYDCALYCNARSERDGLTPCYTKNDSEIFRTYDFSASFTVESNLEARGYRLPTSEEWEYAARGGASGQRFPWGDTVSHSHAVYTGASYEFTYDLNNGPHPDYWFNDDVPPFTAPVGDLPVNGYGLYHMGGNVMEFTGPATPVTQTSLQPVRGGSWNDGGDRLRCGDESVTKSAFFSDTKTGFRTIILGS